MSERHRSPNAAPARFSVLLGLPDDVEPFDPDPEVSRARDVTLVREVDDTTRGIVGWSTGGQRALALASEHPGIERLVLVALPFPDSLEAYPDLDLVTARTLLLFGSADPATGSRHGRRWRSALPNARLEMVPGGGHELLGRMWSRILSHLAPRRRAATQEA